MGGRNKPDPFPFDEPTTISISSTGVEFVGTATDIASDLLTDYLGSKPATIKELREDIGEDALTDDVIRKALKGMVSAGKAEVSKGGMPPRQEYAPPPPPPPFVQDGRVFHRRKHKPLLRSFTERIQLTFIKRSTEGRLRSMRCHARRLWTERTASYDRAPTASQ